MNSGVCARKGCKTPLTHMRADAVWCSRACAMAAKRAGQSARKPNRKRSGRSGLQVSYFKAVDALTRALEQMPVARPELIAQRILREALSEQQRARLEARS